MLTNKVFLRKTKRGNILKVRITPRIPTNIKSRCFLFSFQIIREHYLRTDLWCGSSLCVICPHEKHDLVLSSEPQTKSSLVTGPHYLLLDTNVVLDQIDVFEEDVIQDVIVLQTVLDEVRHKSAAVYKRLREILNNPGRRFYTFVNEHHR
jgi:exosome complex exonuclease DIS3/RRP44